MTIMLDGLDDVDWAKLKHAYGPADDVPGQLRDLVSPDESVRTAALDELFGNIFHQGTIYEATPHAVPFLLEALPECPEQETLLLLLTSIVTGYDERWLPETIPVAGHRESAATAEDPEAKAYNDCWVRIYDGVRAGVPLFRELLNAAPPVRAMAAYALAWFQEEAEESLRALAPISAGDPEDFVAATASVAMGLLGGRPAFGDPRPLARWGAAIALATVDRRDASDEVVGELVAATAGALPDNRDIPFLDGYLGAYAAAALRLTGDSERTFHALLTHIPSVTGLDAYHVVEAALHLAFPSGPTPAGTLYAALDDRPRRLADALAGTPEIWLYNGASYDQFGVLTGAYGLPASNEAMRDYASTS
ncbi:hypothetical protein AB0E59_07410 [Lentzea sp. NPDC034063]|uniref:hypothetical protein n=1 Tax=unclassified Lentzea TaxID=2643253 RepID=UPI003402FA32